MTSSWHPGSRCGCPECVKRMGLLEAEAEERWMDDRVETRYGSRPMNWSERQKARREAGE